jgi:hypothetical protein
MMKPTEDRAGDELTETLDGSMSWRILAAGQPPSASASWTPVAEARSADAAEL